MDNPQNWTKAWLANARITDDPVGDVIADLKRDPNVPRLFHNAEEMRNYIRSRQGCREAIAAVSAVWKRYRRWQDRHPVWTFGD